MKSRHRLNQWLTQGSAKHSHLNLNQGLSLPELITSTLIASMVISVALGGSMFNRQLYAQDEVRTRVNQSLRSSMDLVGADIQQMGEQILRDDPFFPVVELSRNPANPQPNDNTWTSTLTIRRNLLPPLPVCENLGDLATSTASASITTIRVFERASTVVGSTRPPGTCPELSGTDPTTSPPAVDATLTQWNAALTANNNRLRAFLYDGNGGGQFVIVTSTGNAADANSRFITMDAAPGVQFYANGSSRLYLLEQRTYQVDNNNLQLTIDNGAPQTIVSGIQRFQVRISTNPVAPATALVPNFDFCERTAADRCLDPTGTSGLDAWSVINHLRVTIVATDPSLGPNDQIRSKALEASRTLSEDFFPRNVMNFN